MPFKCPARAWQSTVRHARNRQQTTHSREHAARGARECAGCCSPRAHVLDVSGLWRVHVREREPGLSRGVRQRSPTRRGVGAHIARLRRGRCAAAHSPCLASSGSSKPSEHSASAGAYMLAADRQKRCGRDVTPYARAAAVAPVPRRRAALRKLPHACEARHMRVRSCASDAGVAAPRVAQARSDARKHGTMAPHACTRLSALLKRSGRSPQSTFAGGARKWGTAGTRRRQFPPFYVTGTNRVAGNAPLASLPQRLLPGRHGTVAPRDRAWVAGALPVAQLRALDGRRDSPISAL